MSFVGVLGPLYMPTSNVKTDFVVLRPSASTGLPTVSAEQHGLPCSPLIHHLRRPKKIKKTLNPSKFDIIHHNPISLLARVPVNYIQYLINRSSQSFRQIAVHVG